jgi:hypothetical protein
MFLSYQFLSELVQLENLYLRRCNRMNYRLLPPSLKLLSLDPVHHSLHALDIPLLPPSLRSLEVRWISPFTTLSTLPSSIKELSIRICPITGPLLLDSSFLAFLPSHLTYLSLQCTALKIPQTKPFPESLKGLDFSDQRVNMAMDQFIPLLPKNLEYLDLGSKELNEKEWLMLREQCPKLSLLHSGNSEGNLPDLERIYGSCPDPFDPYNHFPRLPASFFPNFHFLFDF